MTATTEKPIPREGPKARVLHIGNIANNAYLNARILNELGYENHVVVSNYFHVMAWPEWEECSFSSGVGDHFTPRFPDEAYASWQRPDWFVQGPRFLCRNLLAAMQTGGAREKAWRWVVDQVLRRPALRGAHQVFRALELAGGITLGDWRGVGRYVRRVITGRSRPRDRAGDLLTPRRHGLLESELGARQADLARWLGVLRSYDVVIGYATEGWMPLLAGVPYIAYEHGTIRALPFEDSEAGRLCAATYREADQVLITNCDNIDAAEALELSRYRFIPHPVNERTLPVRGFREELRKMCDADFVVFHPSRQHWEARRDPSWEKGNDVFLRGFAKFHKNGRHRAAAVLVNWGATVEASRELIRELGIEGRVHWIEPQPHLAMAEYIEASDVVADQFYLGAFGSTTPKAMFLERPVLLNLDEDRHRWAFPELPPVCHAETDEQVAIHLRRLADDPAYARDLGRRSKQWYEKWHSNQVVGSTLAATLSAVLDEQ